MRMNPLEKEAMRFAQDAHRNQMRKYTGYPYITHPANVAQIVSTVPHTEEMLAAAWLHDVVEDCGVLEETLLDKFGAEVTKLVMALTDISKPEHGNREKRKEMDRVHLAAAPAEAKTIKLADLIDNTSSIVTHDPNFAKVYLAEKRLLLRVLKDGDKTLLGTAYAQLVIGEEMLVQRMHLQTAMSGAEVQ